ncbi:type II CAAX prenyl endopeptidase Rce1 family protein [Streptomyces sp. NPDC059009]|uniref:CPBP family glutamic-type intramembrane protease n=1 Tax=Streptomyces sp. NPDC059009 TaxID=3346694 RepID=UPI003683BD15
MSGAVAAAAVLLVAAGAYGVLVPWLARHAPGRFTAVPPARARSLAGAAAGGLVTLTAALCGTLPWHPPAPDGTTAALVLLGLALGCGEFAAAAFLASVVADTGAALRGTRAVRVGERGRAAPRRAPRPASAAGQTHWLGLARGQAAEEARARVAGPGAAWGVVALAVAVVAEEGAFRAGLVSALAGAGAVAAVGLAVLAHAAVQVRAVPAGRRTAPDVWLPALLVPAVHAVLYWRTGTLTPLLAADAAYLALLIPTERKRS